MPGTSDREGKQDTASPNAPRVRLNKPQGEQISRRFSLQFHGWMVISKGVLRTALRADPARHHYTDAGAPVGALHHQQVTTRHLRTVIHA